MSYCLKLREPLPKGLKRIFREQIQSALKLCRHPAKEHGVTVHEVRKHLKRLRAALRLTKGEVGKSRWASGIVVCVKSDGWSRIYGMRT